MKPATDLWSLAGPTCACEQTIAAGLIDDSLDVVQRCRAAGIVAADFSYDPFAPVARAAFRLVEWGEWANLNHFRRIDLLSRLAARECDRRVWTLDDVLALGTPSPREVSSAIARFVRICRNVRIARQHSAALRRSLDAAYRAATENPDDVRPVSVVARRKGDVPGAARELSPARDVRALAPVPGLARGPHPRGGEGQRGAGRMGEEVARHRQRQAG